MKKLLLSTLLLIPLSAPAQTAYQKTQFCELTATVAKATAMLREIHIPRDIAIKRIEESLTQPELRALMHQTMEISYDSPLSSDTLERLYREVCMKKMFGE